jgi:hypothetical protein
MQSRTDARRFRRADHTDDLRAAVRPPRGGGRAVRVCDLSAGGMAVEPMPDVRPQERVRFEFWGPAFAWSGTARVVHADESRAGLAFLSWDGPTHRPLERLIDART